MRDGGGDVTVVAPPGSALGAALGSALGAREWRVLDVRSLRPERALLHPRAVLLLEDDEGVPVVDVEPGAGLLTCVCLGSARSARELQGMHRRGAVVLDQSAPLLALLRILEHHLRETRGPGPPDDAVVGELGRRHDEHVALTRLTATEEAVLALLAAGVGAAQIGARRHLSLNTVRTHIRSILTKLGVRSQLEAVAVARRSGSARWLVEPRVTFTNSGEAPAPPHGGR
ncbi:helix-turn-helix transcriptional regulator [Cellulomonas sp. S1-8]|uniref:helix-turn-helix transcriptional regulator n=1 Tax=Cellulomonas sp. S1-8 TaxID=2904790 RepID=UPI00224488F9|nr:helix-turn-helix transcriptional regulator [Cellulomonas sp. S1-8]UZN03846.1 helix-turn-helix transcriptional regulator [Cellulomonas sp. S1-8]